MSFESFQNPACFLYGPGDARIQDSPLPTITSPYEVIIRIAYIGVCGSDVHFWTQGGIQQKITPTHPLIPGHEATGTIISIGSLVTSLKPGDAVAIEPSLPCRRCPACKSGTYHLCPHMRFASSPPSTHGMLVKYFKTKEDFCYKLPFGVGFQEGVLVEPLAVAVHVAKLAGVKIGMSVVIFGAGTVGLLSAAVVKAMGAGKVVIVDVNAGRLEVAKRTFGTSGTYIPPKSLSPSSTALEIIAQNDLGGGADIVLEATGVESCIEAGIEVLCLGGTMVQAGLGKMKIEFPIVKLSEKEISLKGSFRYGAGDFETAVRLLEKGKVEVKDLISEVVGFERVTEAWELTRKGVGIKNLIEGPRD